MNTENKKTLKTRAEKLAKPFVQQGAVEDFLEVLFFDLGEEKYGIETKYIAEVYPLKNHTPRPCAPPFVYGFANVRRKIILILDLKILFSIPNTLEKKSIKKLVILGSDEKGFSIITDGFIEIQKIVKESLQTSLPTLTGIREDFLKGLTPNGIVILDGQKLLTSDHLVINEGVN